MGRIIGTLFYKRVPNGVMTDAMMVGVANSVYVQASQARQVWINAQGLVATEQVDSSFLPAILRRNRDVS